MKNKKILIIFILAIAFLLLLSVKSEASLNLKKLDFDAQINSDGSMDVTETWNIYISETNTLFKTFKIDSSKYSSITNVTVEQIKPQNIELTQTYQEAYHVPNNCYYALKNVKGMFEIAWGVGLDNDSETRTYKISYTVNDVIAQYNDYSQLYWQFVGEDFEIDADEITGVIKLPYAVDNKEDVRVWGHTKYLNGEIYVTDVDEIEFKINRYSNGNYVEVRSLIPNYLITSGMKQYNRNILDEVLEEETKWAEEANAKRNQRKLIVNILTVIVAVFVIFFMNKLRKNFKRLKATDKKNKPTTKLDYFRELPYEGATPAEALFIMSEGYNTSFSKSFSANILDLCLEKYISIETVEQNGKIKSDIVKINLLDKDSTTLKEDEKMTLELLKKVAGEEKQLTTKDITKYLEKHSTAIDKINKEYQKVLETEEEKSGKYSKENSKNKIKLQENYVLYYVLAFFAFLIFVFGIEGLEAGAMGARFSIVSIIFVLIAIMNGYVSSKIASRINVLSQKGIDEKEQWNAFKKYMEDFSLLKEKEVPALVVWEKYLVFATAFGISEKVLKQLKVIYPEMNDMNTAMYTYSYIHVMNSVNIGSCVDSSVYSAVGSSGSGSGGGFSGGGGGGRRSEVAAEVAKI